MTVRRTLNEPGDAPRMSPQDLDAEEAVLGCCLLSAAAIAVCAELVGSADFYRPSHGAIFAAILALADRGEPADAVIVAAELRARGEDGVSYADLIALHENTPAISAAPKYARLVAEAARKRRLAHAGREIADAALDPTTASADVLAEGEARLVIAAGAANDGRGLEDIGALVGLAMERVDAAEARGGALSGIPTGLRDLDALLGGMESGSLVVVGARPSMGKTAFGLGVALANVGNDTPTLFVSAEMTKLQIGERTLAMTAKVSVNTQRSGRLSVDQWQRLRSADEHSRSLPLVVDDRSAPTLGQIRVAAKGVQARRGLGLVVVDYLQLVAPRGPGETRALEVGQVAEGLKSLAKDLGCVVVALAQLNRSLESRIDKRPLLADLRESGGIEQAADVVVFIYRDDVYDPDSPDAGTAELLVRKNRSGPMGDVRVAWLATSTRFADLAREPSL